MWSEFKEFAMKGNVIDLAVGVVIGELSVKLFLPLWLISLCRLLDYF